MAQKGWTLRMGGVSLDEHFLFLDRAQQKAGDAMMTGYCGTKTRCIMNQGLDQDGGYGSVSMIETESRRSGFFFGWGRFGAGDSWTTMV